MSPVRKRLHRLAERLGYTVGELCDRLGYRELADWVVYERDGLGGPRDLASMSKADIAGMLKGG